MLSIVNDNKEENTSGAGWNEIMDGRTWLWHIFTFWSIRN